MADEVPEVRWVGVGQGRSAWATAAQEILTGVAGQYLGLITYADLAEQVQASTGLRTRAPYRSWIGSVLAGVVAQCRADGLPPLTSLVVHRAGGDVDTTESTFEARIACYRRYSDDVPLEVIVLADAAIREKAEAEARAAREPARRPRGSARSAAPGTRKKAPAEEPPKICPTCFMQLPVSGVCENCS